MLGLAKLSLSTLGPSFPRTHIFYLTFFSTNLAFFSSPSTLHLHSSRTRLHETTMANPSESKSSAEGLTHPSSPPLKARRDPPDEVAFQAALDEANRLLSEAKAVVVSLLKVAS